jgi:hypothetical protein
MPWLMVLRVKGQYVSNDLYVTILFIWMSSSETLRITRYLKNINKLGEHNISLKMKAPILLQSKLNLSKEKLTQVTQI